MYFIAFFVQTKNHRVVPFKWVRGINYENLINNGINRNLKFEAFYTSNPNAFNKHGIPKASFNPNPNANGTVFPNEGWYSCHLRKFNGTENIYLSFLYFLTRLSNLHSFLFFFHS